MCQHFSFYHFRTHFPAFSNYRIVCFSFISYFFSPRRCEKLSRIVINVINVNFMCATFEFLSLFCSLGCTQSSNIRAHIWKLFGRLFVGVQQPANISDWLSPKNESLNQRSQIKMCDSMWCMINSTILCATLHQTNFWIGFFAFGQPILNLYWMLTDMMYKHTFSFSGNFNTSEPNLRSFVSSTQSWLFFFSRYSVVCCYFFVCSFTFL